MCNGEWNGFWVNKIRKYEGRANIFFYFLKKGKESIVVESICLFSFFEERGGMGNFEEKKYDKLQYISLAEHVFLNSVLFKLFVYYIRGEAGVGILV